MKIIKKKINFFHIKTSWGIEFYIYRNIFLNPKGKINLQKSRFLKKYSIEHKSQSKSSKNSYSKLKCHLDFNLFYGLLKRKYSNWNHPLSGSLILYERTPNKFDPNLFFSLNFFTTK